MSRAIEHRGCRLVYDLHGVGPPVLFIQGVGIGGGGWRPQVDGLGDRFECLSFDNRGIGHSQPEPETLTVGQMADDAAAVLDAEETESAHVVGHSLGGLVAVSLALAARHRVRSLSLLCTFPSGHAAAPFALRLMWLGLRTKFGTRRMRRRAFLRLVMSPQGYAACDPDKLADQLGEMFGHDLADQQPVADLQLQALRAADATTGLKELAGIPTLVVSGAHDPIAPPRAGKALAAGIPGARYVEFADASHGLPVEHPDRANDLLAEHLTAAEARHATAAHVAAGS